MALSLPRQAVAPPTGVTVTAFHSTVRNSALEPGVRPAPVVLGGGVVDLDAVRRGEHAAAGGRDAPQLADRLLRVDRVLEHLVQRITSKLASGTGSDSTEPWTSAAGFSTTSTPTYSEAPSRKKG